MSYFAYFDRDYFRNAGHYPLVGDHCECLLRLCFEYSSVVSFLFRGSDSTALSPIEKWKVPATNTDDRLVYKTSDAVLDVMISWTTYLFECPAIDSQVCMEDPVFYRADGTIFFEAITHEGECSIYPRNNENISALFGFGHWLLMNEDGTPSVPAKEHLLPFPTKDEIVGDLLYQDLMSIYENSVQDLTLRSINEICSYIRDYRPPHLRNVTKNPPSFISFLPKWYQSFEMYALSKCNAKTGIDIQTVILQTGCTDSDGFEAFYRFLEEFVALSDGDKGQGNGLHEL